MKKYIGAICSALTGGLMFLFLSLSWITKQTIKSSAVSDTKGYLNGYEMLKEQINNTQGDVAQGYMLYKVSAIIMIVVASLLLISAAVIILKNLKVFKTKINLVLINNVILLAAVVCAILCLVATNQITGQLFEAIIVGYGTKYVVGAGAWLPVAVSSVLCVASWFTFKMQKSK